MVTEAGVSWATVMVHRAVRPTVAVTVTVPAVMPRKTAVLAGWPWAGGTRAAMASLAEDQVMAASWLPSGRVAVRVRVLAHRQGGGGFIQGNP